MTINFYKNSGYSEADGVTVDDAGSRYVVVSIAEGMRRHAVVLTPDDARELAKHILRVAGDGCCGGCRE